jgi:hypothetical protein
MAYQLIIEVFSPKSTPPPFIGLTSVGPWKVRTMRLLSLFLFFCSVSPVFVMILQPWTWTTYVADEPVLTHSEEGEGGSSSQTKSDRITD